MLESPPNARHRTARRVAAAAVAVTAVAALSAPIASARTVTPATTAGSAPAAPAGSSINGYRSVGYFMADSPVSRGYEVKDLVTTGAVKDLTHLNYAFGNVTSDLVCDITTTPGEGDAQNDFLRLVPADRSVDGKADKPGQQLAGNFNQLRKLKAKSPSTKVLVSIGGWTWSDNFSEAASTPEGRTKLVDSCLDLYIDGDLPVIDGKGGKGAAAGIFDGIDIDWEWPVTGGETANARPEDKENFLALMAQFRSELDARGAAAGKHYLLSAFAPAGGWNAGEGGWLDKRLFSSVDFLNVQGYDFAGGWTTENGVTVTGHQGNLHPDGDHNWGLGLDGAMKMYVDAGASPAQLNAGLAAYGQGWGGVKDGTKAWQPGASIGTEIYAKLRSVGKAYFDPAIGASWRWDKKTGEWWSLDDPASVNAKAEWLAVQGYGGAMWWDVTGDYKNELGGTLATTLRAATPGPQVPSTCAAPWYATGVYTKGDVVSANGTEYKARWYTRGEAPRASAYGAWEEIGPCGTAPKPPAPTCAPAWDATATYHGGDKVSRAGVNYTAQWWTKGELPGSVSWGSWDPGLPCKA